MSSAAYVKLPEEKAPEKPAPPKRRPSLLRGATSMDLSVGGPRKSAAGSSSNSSGSPSSTGRRQNLLSGKQQVPSVVPEEDWERYVTVLDNFLLFPLGRFKFKWDLVMMGLIIYSCISVPFRLGLNHPAAGTWWGIELIVSLCFVADVILTFNTAFLDGDHLLLDKVMIRNAYLRSWFLTDALSAVPMELVDLAVVLFLPHITEEGGYGHNSLRWVRAMRLVRMLRLLRLLKIQRYINILEEELHANLQLLQLVKVVGAVVYLAHLLGCFWFWLGVNSAGLRVISDADEFDLLHDGTDRLADAAGPGANFGPSWISEYNDGAGLSAGVWVRYLYSFYWALTTLTTVGYGDITPVNDSERVYTIFTELVGTLCFGYMINAVANVLNTIDPNAVRIQQKVDEVKVYLRWHRFPPDLALRVKRYYDFFYSRRSAMDEEAILANLAPTLRRDVQAHLLSRTVGRIPLFRECTLTLQLEINARLKPLLREAGESIVDALTKGSRGGASIFFLHRGTVSAKASLGEDVPLFDLDAGTSAGGGCIIGEHALMAKSQCICTYGAATRCELFAVGLEEFYAIAQGHMLSEEVDAMAGTIYDEFVHRHMLRAISLSLRLIPSRQKDGGGAPASTSPPWARSAVVVAANATASAEHATPPEGAQTPNGGIGRRDQAALRIQICWMHKQARGLRRRDNDMRPLEELVPGLYYNRRSFTLKSKAGVGGVFRGASPPPGAPKQALSRQRTMELQYIEQDAMSDALPFTRKNRRSRETKEEVGGADSGPLSPTGGLPPLLAKTLAEMQAQLVKLVEAEEKRSEKLAEAVERAVARALAKGGVAVQ